MNEVGRQTVRVSRNGYSNQIHRIYNHPYSTISYYNVKDRRFNQSFTSGRKLEKFMNARIVNIPSSNHGHWARLVAMFATYDSGAQFTDTRSS